MGHEYGMSRQFVNKETTDNHGESVACGSERRPEGSGGEDKGPTDQAMGPVSFLRSLFLERPVERVIGVAPTKREPDPHWLVSVRSDFIGRGASTHNPRMEHPRPRPSPSSQHRRPASEALESI